MWLLSSCVSEQGYCAKEITLWISKIYHL